MALVSAVTALLRKALGLAALLSLGFWTSACPKSGASRAARPIQTIRIHADTSDPAPKAAIQSVVEAFNAAHQNEGLVAKLSVYDHESYKSAIRNWLSAEAPDLVFWYAGERMKTFALAKLLTPVDDLWESAELDRHMAAYRASVSFGGQSYAIPYTTYPWGVYYRKDLFEAHQLAVPKTWTEFKAVAAKLKKAGITPFAIGTKFLWPAAAWFDYLNLRINGLDFHQALMAGEASYLDPRVQKVFDHWQELIEPGYFLKEHAAYSWQEAQPFFFQGKAAMYLMGSFITPNIPKDLRDQIGFFPFPVIDPAQPRFEDSPTDTICIPRLAKNPDGARRFLRFMLKPEHQATMNDALQQIPTDDRVPKLQDPFVLAGAKLLAASKGHAQFFDRDTDPELAKIAMKAFQELMLNPKRRDESLRRVEDARLRILERQQSQAKPEHKPKPEPEALDGAR